MARVMIVEDDGFCREYLRTNLEEIGLDVVDARNTMQAGQMLASENVDLLIVDIVLTNGEDGLQFAEQARRGRLGAGIIVITGNASAERVQRCRKLGAVAYFEKPFDVSDFKRCVQDFLDRRELLREVHRLEQELAAAKDMASIEADADTHVIDSLWFEIFFRLGVFGEAPPGNPFTDPA